MEKDEFLSNEHKKSKLIEMMKKYFLIDGQTVMCQMEMRIQIL